MLLILYFDLFTPVFLFFFFCFHLNDSVYLASGNLSVWISENERLIYLDQFHDYFFHHNVSVSLPSAIFLHKSLKKLSFFFYLDVFPCYFFHYSVSVALPSGHLSAWISEKNYLNPFPCYFFHHTVCLPTGHISVSETNCCYYYTLPGYISRKILNDLLFCFSNVCRIQ